MDSVHIWATTALVLLRLGISDLSQEVGVTFTGVPATDRHWR